MAIFTPCWQLHSELMLLYFIHSILTIAFRTGSSKNPQNILLIFLLKCFRLMFQLKSKLSHFCIRLTLIFNRLNIVIFSQLIKCAIGIKSFTSGCNSAFIFQHQHYVHSFSLFYKNNFIRTKALILVKNLRTS